MKKIFILVFILSFFSLTFAERTITVTGEGESKSAPDIVAVDIYLISKNEDYKIALKDNQEKTNAIKNLSKKYDILEKDISSRNYNVHFQSPNDHNKLKKGIYNINNNITVKMKNIEKIGEYISDSLNAGASNINRVSFGIDNKDAIVKEARKNAVIDARRKAEDLASAENLKVGKILNIHENGSPRYSPYPVEYRGAKSLDANMAEAATVIAPQELTTNASVTITFELQ